MHSQWVKFLILLQLFAGLAASSLRAGKIPTEMVEARVLSKVHSYLFSSSEKKGLFFFSQEKNRLIRITPNTGTVFSFDGGRWLGLKWIRPGQNGRPIVYHTEDSRIQTLPSSAANVGVPSFSRTGQIAYCDGNEIVLADSNGISFQRIRIPFYANLTPISPDGRWVAYNDSDDQIWIVSTTNPRNRRKLTDGRHAYFHPRWSHASDRLLIQSIDGKLFVSGLRPNTLKELAEGTHPVWSPDDRWVAFEKPVWGEQGFISNWDIAAIRSDGSQTIAITNTPEILESSPQFISQNEISYVENQMRILTKSFGFKHSLQKSQVRFSFPNVAQADSLPIRSSLQKVAASAGPGEIIDIPYVHQVYDTPDWFDGYWACGATSAIMVIAHYPILPKWSLYVSQPFGHRTYWGRYICTVYTYRTHTFNIWSYDRLGNRGYGGYGFITQNHWADTKGYMARYFQYHGLASSVDWSPAWNDLRREIDNQRPFVLLNSLTSAGHYIDVVGYYENRSVVVNDPYGNKNRGYTNYYGKQAVYDWPGYDNGYSNLNTVWCFIYAQKAPDFTVDTLLCPDSLKIGDTFSVSFKISNAGLATGDSITVALYLSPDQSLSTHDWLVASRKFSGLAPEDSAFHSLTGTLPDNLTSRVLYGGIWIDPGKENLEGDRTNNQIVFPIVVEGYPSITRLVPGPGSVTTQNPLRVEASYSDAILGIDTTRVRLFIDSTDVTSRSEISAEKISFRLENPSNKTYSARVVVTNTAGLSVEKNWTFSVNILSEITQNKENSPGTFTLFQNYPNPFEARQGTAIRFRLRCPVQVHITIYNVVGELVREWNFARLPAGKQHIFWNGRDGAGRWLVSGIYFLHIRAGDFSARKRIVLLK
ncbi:MAG: T9SS type A sorting domain-containing protein [Calditrichaeota bacterium]|nr:T9SS type A sorting domain-containing protein [Calditrichota bacterium]